MDEVLALVPSTTKTKEGKRWPTPFFMFNVSPVSTKINTSHCTKIGKI
jgi:hypothetical protein